MTLRSSALPYHDPVTGITGYQFGVSPDTRARVGPVVVAVFSTDGHTFYRRVSPLPGNREQGRAPSPSWAWAMSPEGPVRIATSPRAPLRALGLEHRARAQGLILTPAGRERLGVHAHVADYDHDVLAPESAAREGRTSIEIEIGGLPLCTVHTAGNFVTAVQPSPIALAHHLSTDHVMAVVAHSLDYYTVPEPASTTTP